MRLFHLQHLRIWRRQATDTFMLTQKVDIVQDENQDQAMIAIETEIMLWQVLVPYGAFGQYGPIYR
jgi:hypothetical protein